MLRIATTSALALMMAVPAAAQEITYGKFSLDYGQLSDDGFETSATSLSGAAEYSIDQFLLGAQLNNQSLDGDFADATFNTLGAFAAYAPSSELLFGAGLTSLSIDTGSTDETIDGYELFAQYTTPGFGSGMLYSVPDTEDEDFTVTTFYAQAEAAPGVTVGLIVDSFSEFDESPYILSAEYEDGPIFARAYYVGVTDEDLSVFGARGSYAINPMFHVTASLASFEEFLAEEGSAVTVGAAYEVAEGVTIDGAIGRFTASDNDINSLQIGLTYETGTRQRLDRTMFDAVLEDRRNGINALFPEVGLGASGFGIF